MVRMLRFPTLNQLIRLTLLFRRNKRPNQAKLQLPQFQVKTLAIPKKIKKITALQQIQKTLFQHEESDKFYFI